MLHASSYVASMLSWRGRTRAVAAAAKSDARINDPLILVGAADDAKSWYCHALTTLNSNPKSGTRRRALIVGRSSAAYK